MNLLARIVRALESPNLFLRHTNRLYHRRIYQRMHNPHGVDVFEEDWDNLLILDACRFDMFETNADLPGDLEWRYSKGSSTVEFLQANFDGRDLRDTVYITSNPQLYRKGDQITANLHDVIHVWKQEGWDEENGTVLPETVTEYAQQAAEEYPDKRLVVHYMQPHYPFIGSQTEFDKGHLTEAEGSRENVWGQLMTGELCADADDIWKPYVENLNQALPHVESLVESLDGQTVVTADHGNMIGERSFPIPITEWGHPRGIYTEQLVKVPWLVHEGDTRRKIVAEEPVQEDEAVAEDVVAERLADLGYTD